MSRYQLNAPAGHKLQLGDRVILGGTQFDADEAEIATLPEGLVSEVGDPNAETYTETYSENDLVDQVPESSTPEKASSWSEQSGS